MKKLVFRTIEPANNAVVENQKLINDDLAKIKGGSAFCFLIIDSCHLTAPAPLPCNPSVLTDR
ncbi:MAG: hypothetical protein WCM76_11345 [Bacteroidota bacterium]